MIRKKFKMKYFTSFLLYNLEENFNLKISLQTEDENLLEKLPYPFLVLSEANPLARLIQGEIITDAGSKIKKVFLFVQRDNYFLSLRPELTNSVIDNMWQENFYFLNNLNNFSPWPFFLKFKTQLDKNGNFVKLPPLWFCKKYKYYFPVFCPICGKTLVECHDDKLLESKGFFPFSSSQKRYLFCPECFYTDKNKQFYVYAKEETKEDLQDRWELVQSYVKILSDKSDKIENFFPCINCIEKERCYGEDFFALKRIVPFSFYPFYMFVFEGLSFRLEEFVKILGGISLNELKNNLLQKRQYGLLQNLEELEIKESVFFSKNQIWESLYLKIALLKEVCNRVAQLHQTTNRADFQLSPERFWINLGTETQLSPLWHFSVKLLPSFNFKFLISDYPSDWPPLFLPQLTNIQDTTWTLLTEKFPKQISGFLTFKEIKAGEKIIIKANWSGTPIFTNNILHIKLGSAYNFRTPISVWFKVEKKEGNEWSLTSAPIEYDQIVYDNLTGLTFLPATETMATVYMIYDKSYDLSSLGLIWFYTLLTNNQQSKEKVINAVKTIFSSYDEFPSLTEIKQKYPEIADIFSSKNLMWNNEFELDDEKIWQEVLTIGWQLLNAKKDWDYFEKSLERIKRKIKMYLFSTSEEDLLENKEIYQILAKIKEKWEKEESLLEPERIERTVIITAPEEMSETVVISPEPSKEKSDEAELEETTIISSEFGGK